MGSILHCRLLTESQRYEHISTDATFPQINFFKWFVEISHVYAIGLINEALNQRYYESNKASCYESNGAHFSHGIRPTDELSLSG